jgi:hypothetical protein
MKIVALREVSQLNEYYERRVVIMNTYQVTNIDKPTRMTRIKRLAGPGWTKTEDQVIDDINNDRAEYFVRNGQYSAWVRVEYNSPSGLPYLKTIPDGIAVDNLTFLAEI